MATSLQTIRRMTIESRAVGVDETSQKLARLGQAQDAVAESSEKATAQTSAYERALDSQRRALDMTTRLSAELARDRMAMSAQLQQQNAMLVAANDNSAKSFTVMGLEAAEAANHLRVAGEAAYLFSPAFREVVNGMAAPALRGASVALVAVAGGIVTATNLAGTGLVKLGTSAALASTGLTPVAASITSAGLAMQAFNPSVAGVAATILGRLLPALRLLGTVGLVVNAAMMVADAWELGGKKLEEYRKIAEKAAATDLSTAFFQRITKAATDAKLPVDDLTASMRKLSEVSAEKLGGSDLQNRLDQLTKAGNFKGNTGVGQLAAANTTEEKFRAIVSLVDQAMLKGERLAALDLTSKFLSPATQEALTKDSEYLGKMLASADKISATKLVSDEDIGAALELQNRYDAAVKILETRWHPIQDLLTAAGVKMQTAWVGIVEAVATAVDWITRLVMKIGEIPQTFWDYIKKGAAASVSLAVGAVPVVGPALSLGARIATSGGEGDVAAVDEKTKAYGRLAAGLRNVNAVQQKTAEINAIQSAVWKDASKPIETATKAALEHKDALIRAMDAVEKYILTTEAAAKSVGAGVFEQEKAKVVAQLTAAAQRDGKTNLAQYAAAWDELGNRAGAAAQKLALANAQSQADFAGKTMFMSPSDLAAANVMKNIYGDAWQSHMDDALAKQIKMNSLLGDVKNTAQQFAQTFVQGLMQGKSGMDALVAAADQLAGKLANDGIANLMSLNPEQMGVGALQLGASALISMFTGDQKAKKQLEEAKKQWEGMTSQVNAFNAAAAGVDLGPLTNELNSLFSSFRTLAHAAAEAHDEAGRTRVGNTLYKGAMRVISEFERGTDTLNPLQQSIKAVNDEAAGLKDTLAEISAANHWSFDTSGIDAAVKVKIQNLIKNAMDTFTDSLTSRLNAANGQGYLNDATALAKRRQQDLSDAAILGNDPALLAQISAVFHAEAQKIVNDAGLVGAEFADFTALFPDFAGVVTESADALAAANDRFKAMTETINDYLDSLQLGDKSILNPQEQLKAAQSQFNAQLALAQSGNADAMGTITQYASALLDQAKGFYASSAGYGDVYSAVTEALRGLTGGQGVIAGTGAAMLQQTSLAGPQLQSNAALAVTQPLASRITASNDNGQYFVNLGQQLVQAMAGCSMGEISAMREENEKLRAEVRNLITAVEGNRPRAPRPSARTGTNG
jgi:hypothetical protein